MLIFVYVFAATKPGYMLIAGGTPNDTWGGNFWTMSYEIAAASEPSTSSTNLTVRRYALKSTPACRQDNVKGLPLI